MPIPFLVWAAIALAILFISGGTSNAIMQVPSTVAPTVHSSGSSIMYAIALGVVVLTCVFAVKIWSNK